MKWWKAVELCGRMVEAVKLCGRMVEAGVVAATSVRARGRKKE